MALVRISCRIFASKPASQLTERNMHRRFASSLLRVAVATRKNIDASLMQRNTPLLATRMPDLFNGGRLCSSTAADDEKVYVSEDIHFDAVKECVRAGNVSFLDVRQAGEIAQTGRIANAYNVPVEELMNALNMKDPEFIKKYSFSKAEIKKSSLVVYSDKGHRALEACEILDTYGFKSVKRYTGGWKEWEAMSR